MKIAFFDSGLGGLSVLHRAMKQIPQAQFIFFADEDNVPYGTKPREEILRLVDDAFSFLAAQRADAIVVACNTATSVAAAAMRQKYSLPIIGMEPAVKPALKSGNGRVLVVATPVTVHGEKLQRLLTSLNAAERVDSVPLPALVDFAERSEFVGAAVEDYLREKLSPFDLTQYSSLVLGCTHFNYFKDSFRRLLPPNVGITDGNEGTVNELIRRLPPFEQSTAPPTRPEYFYSRRTVKDERELRRLEVYLQRLDEMFLIK